MSTREPQQTLDQYLVVLAQSGSRGAFDKLVRHWTPMLLRFATRTVGRSELARDVLQETWIAAVRGLRGLNDPASFPAWIYGITHRKCVDAIRANQRWRRLSESARQEAQAADPSILAAPAPRDSGELGAALGQLNAEHRVVVDLFYGEELSVAQIAAALDLPAGTVKSRLFHARATLKKHLGD